MSAHEIPIQVLLVDDEHDFLDATERALRRRGFDPFTANNGLKALALLDERPVDVVVLDMKMPGIDGEQVFYEIRRRWRDLPVIILTGHGTVKQAFRTTKDGVFDYLTKPCEIEELARLLGKAAAVSPNRQPSASTHARLRTLLVQSQTDGPVATPGLLSSWGMAITLCHTFDTASEAIASRGFDVVLLDLTYLGVGGIELQRALTRRYPSAAVIPLVDRSTMALGLESLRAGAFDLLVAPFGVGTLVRKIREAKDHNATRSRSEQERRIREIVERYPD